MADEYVIRVSSLQGLSIDWIEKLLNNLPFFCERPVFDEEEFLELRMRVAEARSSMPDLSISIRKGDVHLCCYGDVQLFHQVLGVLVAKLVGVSHDENLEVYLAGAEPEVC